MPDNKQFQTTDLTADEKRGTAPTLLVDYKKYEKMLDESDLDEDQKRAFLETLWSIIVGFVDLGFGVHPMQQCRNKNVDDCEHIFDLSSLMAGDVVSSAKGISNNQFNPAVSVSKDTEVESEEL